MARPIPSNFCKPKGAVLWLESLSNIKRANLEFILRIDSLSIFPSLPLYLKHITNKHYENSNPFINPLSTFLFCL